MDPEVLPPNPGTIGPVKPTHVFWATPISRPLMASFYTQNLGNIWVLLSFPELPWVFCLLWDGPATGLLEICGTGPSWLERWGLTPGAHRTECQSLPFKAPFLILLLLLPLCSIWCWEIEKTRTPDPILSLSSLDKNQTVSIHNMTFCVSLTELCGLSFFKLIFKVYKNIFYFPFLKNIKIFRDSLLAHLVKNPPAMWETPAQFLDWEDLLEKG